MTEPSGLGLADNETITDVTFEVNEGPRWIDQIDQIHEKFIQED